MNGSADTERRPLDQPSLLQVVADSLNDYKLSSSSLAGASSCPAASARVVDDVAWIGMGSDQHLVHVLWLLATMQFVLEHVTKIVPDQRPAFSFILCGIVRQKSAVPSLLFKVWFVERRLICFASWAARKNEYLLAIEQV